MSDSFIECYYQAKPLVDKAGGVPLHDELGEPYSYPPYMLMLYVRPRTRMQLLFRNERIFGPERRDSHLLVRFEYLTWKDMLV